MTRSGLLPESADKHFFSKIQPTTNKLYTVIELNAQHDFCSVMRYVLII